MKIVIEDIPPSLNVFAGRANAWAYRAKKAEWDEKVKVIALSSRTPDMPYSAALVRIDYYFPDKRRRDADNFAGKFIHDGLRLAGVIVDDDFSHISTSAHGHFAQGKKRTEITVVRMVET